VGPYIIEYEDPALLIKTPLRNAFIYFINCKAQSFLTGRDKQFISRNLRELLECPDPDYVPLYNWNVLSTL
jgi:hypothetical protein